MLKAMAAIIIVALIFMSAAATGAQPTVGVKKGEWVEYHVVAGGNPPAAQYITWAKIEIIDVEGGQFHANFTVRYVNGTESTSTRTFNFAAGDVQAWIIIPGNLSPGQSFYDSSTNSNVTIQGQFVRNIAGANRVITYTNGTYQDLERHKEWDKATGFYIQSVDNVTTYTINANAYATNIWSPQILGLDQTTFYSTIGVIVAAVVIASILIIARNKKRT